MEMRVEPALVVPAQRVTVAYGRSWWMPENITGGGGSLDPVQFRSVERRTGCLVGIRLADQVPVLVAGDGVHSPVVGVRVDYLWLPQPKVTRVSPVWLFTLSVRAVPVPCSVVSE